MGRRGSPVAAATVVVAVTSLSGAALGAAGAGMIHRNQEFVARAWPAAGEVVAYDRPDGGAGGGAPLTPVVRYQLSRSEMLRLRPSFVASWRGYEVGQRLTVLYDPKNPDEARIDDFWQLWFLPLLALGLGLALAALPPAALVWALAANARDRRSSAINPRGSI